MNDHVEQRSSEWFALRLGKVTASRLGDVLARTKTGYSASRENYMAELVIERLTGSSVERFQSLAMRRGTELEPQARAAYAFMTGATVAEVGFIPHPQIANSGASPDAAVGGDGLLEIKCCEAAAHLEILLGAATPAKYYAQCQWQLACCQSAWCDLTFFSPVYPPGMDLHIRRIERDSAFIENAETEVVKFLAELEAKVAALRSRYGQIDEAA